MLDALADVATLETTTSFLDGFDQPYRQLGRSNLSVSLAGFGCYRVDEQAPKTKKPFPF